MKKCLLVVFALVLCFTISCGRREAVTVDGDYVVIYIEEDRIASGTTLKDYMDMVVKYDMQDGMVTSIGDVSDGDGKWWMLYTDDTDYAGTFGECVYEGVTYVSASEGASTILVKAGTTYIWYLQAY